MKAEARHPSRAGEIARTCASSPGATRSPEDDHGLDDHHQVRNDRPTVHERERAAPPLVQLRVVSGPNEGAVGTAVGRELSVGTAPGNHLVLTESAGLAAHLWCGGATALLGAGRRLTNGTKTAAPRHPGRALHDGSHIGDRHTGSCSELLEAGDQRAAVEGAALGRGARGVARDAARCSRILACARTRAVRRDPPDRGRDGTGKSVLARAIHDTSPRASHPFVVVDCSSIPADADRERAVRARQGLVHTALPARGRAPGAFESATGGTVFLDEIGELPLELQPKLLRVLESRQVQRIGRVDYIPSTSA